MTTCRGRAGIFMRTGEASLARFVEKEGQGLYGTRAYKHRAVLLCEDFEWSVFAIMSSRLSTVKTFTP